MSFLLDPNASARRDEAATDRFVSMSVTRNAAATVADGARPVAVRATMRLDDIEGARPRALPPFQRSGFHDPADIEGAQPRALHVEKRNHPSLALTNHDIEQSMPRATRFHTQRVVDPVDPRYALPASAASSSAAEPAAAGQAFKRDLHQIGDIEGTSSNGFLRWNSRESMRIDDIGGTSSRARTVIVQGLESHGAHADSLRVKDINEDGLLPNGFRSLRRTNELRPRHVVHGRVVSDDDPGMFVRGAPRGAGSRPFLPLVTEDIDGAKAGRLADVTVGNIPTDKRRFWGVSNMVADVPGACVGSKAPGLTSVRMTDPNERDYVLLDGRRWNAEELAVGKSWYNAAATILAAESAYQAATMPFGRTGIAAAVAPAHNYAKKILDPRDAELARMRGELETLRREREVLTLSHKLVSLQRGGSRAADSAAPVAPAAPAASQDNDAEAERGRGGSSSSTEAPAAAPGGRSSNQQHDEEPASHAFSMTSALSSTLGGIRDEARPPFAVAAHANDRTNAPDPQPAPPPLQETRRMGAGGRTSASAEGARADVASASYVEFDPVASLRATAAAANVRNILGVIPATRPPQDLTGKQSTLREASGRYDAKLDSFPAAPRGISAFAVRSGGHMVGGVYHDSTALRQAVRERAGDVKDVRSLP